MAYRTLSEDEYRDLESRILYEDNHLLVINKRSGEIVQGDKTGDEPVSEKYKAFIAMRDLKPGQVFMGVPHRLDRPVSGICIFAKTSKALERLAEMFRTGNIHKTYWALTCNCPEPSEGELSDWLVRNEKMNKSFICKDHEKHKDARLARLIYKTIAKTDKYYLVEVTLLTGRHHQIRCQLSGHGFCIKGDLKYGAPRSNKDGSISLMAKRVSFVHPVKKTRMEVIAPTPLSWKGVSESCPYSPYTTSQE